MFARSAVSEMSSLVVIGVIILVAVTKLDVSQQ